MKTVTVCGSMRFAESMKNIAFELETRHNINVIQCIYNESEKIITESEKENIVKAHYRKIDISDAIYVVDIDRYIGQSVKEEIEYAKSKGKEIIYHSKFSS